MTYQNLPPRQKSSRLINRLRTEQSQLQFQQYKQRARTISNIAELLPGLNDITDAFEALPIDLVKYFTLLKEIDAKCINTVPQINFLIRKHIEELHKPIDEVEPKVTETNTTVETAESDKITEAATETESGKQHDTLKSAEPTTPSVEPESTTPNTRTREFRRLTLLKEKINEIIPCLEEKMHVTAVASDLVNKHMQRINNDYKLIINNNEIPESIRIGPLNHPAMIVDSTAGGASPGGPGYDRSSAADRSAHSQRSESRREALAAKKASKDDDEPLGNITGGSNAGSPPVGGNTGAASSNGAGSNAYKKKKTRETTPLETKSSSVSAVQVNSSTSTALATSTSGKKRSRKEASEGPQSSANNANVVGEFGVPGLNSSSASGVVYGGVSQEHGTDSNGNPLGAVGGAAGSGPGKKKSKPRREDETKPGIHFRESASRVGSIHTGYRDPSTGETQASTREANNEPTYCYCDQVSFGEMVGCDGDDCKREWFHLPCIGFRQPPKGKWYCHDCQAKMRKRKL